MFTYISLLVSLISTGCPLVHEYNTNSLLCATTASTRLLLSTWLNSWQFTNPTRQLLTLPFSVFHRCACTLLPTLFCLHFSACTLLPAFFCLHSSACIFLPALFCLHSLRHRPFRATPSVWNGVPYRVESSNTLTPFKSSWKSHLFKLSCVCACVCARGSLFRVCFVLCFVMSYVLLFGQTAYNYNKSVHYYYGCCRCIPINIQHKAWYSLAGLHWLLAVILMTR